MRNTTVFGFSMEKRSHRRRLVVAAYTLLAVLAACGWMLDRFRDTGLYIYFAAFFINYYIFGGYGPSGLIRPFSGKAPRAAVPRSLVDVRLNLAGIRTGPEPSDSRNDERELQVRDRVHYQAYQAICVLLAVIWILAMWENHPPRFIPAAVLPMLLYLIVLPMILLAITLPQAIILWTEPDMVPEPDEELAALPTAH
jgi:hypothetical protein